jgi:Alanine dehydrogenase/PNT, N-terminal domain
VIFGVKEVPIPSLMADKTYFFFSHTIKAQEYNMGLLDAMLEKRIRMIDYECIREASKSDGNRLVAFGRYAGIAGAFDFFRGIGEFMLSKKI